MPTAALSTSNAKRRMTKAFMEGAGHHTSVKDQSWAKTFRWRYEKDQAAILSAPYTGVPNFGTWDKSATISADAIAALDPQTITYVAYAAKVSFDPFTPTEIEGYRESVVRKLGFAGASTIAEAAAAVKAAAFTTNMSHGSKPLFAVDHEKASGTRSNKVVGTYDRAAHLTMRNGFFTWENYQGQVYDLSAAGLTIEYHPDNEDAVMQATRSRVTSDQNQVNIVADDQLTYVRNPYFTGTDDVILGTMVPDEQAFMAWERLAPQMYLDTENGGAIDTVTIVFGYAFAGVGTPDGAFGCSIT